MKTAVLVDGAFYKKRSELIYGKMRPDDWVENLMSQCFKHLKHKGSKSELYRIFYYGLISLLWARSAHNQKPPAMRVRVSCYTNNHLPSIIVIVQATM